jgi:formylglycine-generating enzyme required for sulfatase activity
MNRKAILISLLLLSLITLGLASSQTNQLPPGGGVLVIHTDPPEAEVVIDGTSRGQTEREKGLIVSDLGAGKHRLLVRKPWYRSVEREVNIEPGKRTILDLSLGPPIGFLSVRSSVPQSLIKIKGMGSFNNEVHRLEVSVGKYQVTVEPPNRQSRAQVVEVKIGLETDLLVDFGLAAPSADVKVASRPVDVVNLGRADRAPLMVEDRYGSRVGGSLVPEIISLAGGSFEMGSDSGGEDERPIHTVVVDGFDMARFEITNAQYKAFCDATGRQYPSDPEEWGNYFLVYPNHPVVMVSWDDAAAYCEWLSKLTGTTYRLPTEAEWEYAARGKLTGKKYPWGDEDPAGRACYLQGQIPLGVPTMRVGSFAPNGYELYNMAGNVWEWCFDWYDVSYYRSGNNRNPQGAPSGTMRVARGGAWLYDANSLRCAIRLKLSPYTQHETVGFRVARVRTVVSSQ